MQRNDSLNKGKVGFTIYIASWKKFFELTKIFHDGILLFSWPQLIVPRRLQAEKIIERTKLSLFLRLI